MEGNGAVRWQTLATAVTPQHHPPAGSRVTSGPARCDGCGRFYHRDYLRGPYSQKLCAHCDTARIAPPSVPAHGVIRECAGGCRTEDFCEPGPDGVMRCRYCAELEAGRGRPREGRHPAWVLASVLACSLIAAGAAGHGITELLLLPGLLLGAVVLVLG